MTRTSDKILQQTFCVHARLRILLDGLLATTPGRMTILEPGVKVRARIACMDCGLVGPWQNPRRAGLPRPAMLRRALSRFYSRACEMDQTAAEISQDLEYMETAQRNKEKRKKAREKNEGEFT